MDPLLKAYIQEKVKEAEDSYAREGGIPLEEAKKIIADKFGFDAP